MTTTPNLGLTYYESGQLQPEVTINGDLDILDSAIGSLSSAFGYDAATSTGLNYGYFGGPILVNGVDTLIAAGTILLTASATNYVERTAAGAVSVNQTGFTLGLIPMAIVTTSASAIISPVLDRRPSAYDRQGRIVVTTTGGALTLTAAQANAKIISVQGVLTSNSVLTLPNLQQDWTISNETTGAFTLSAQIGTGSPIGIDQGKSAQVYGNGTILKSSESRLLQEADLFGDFVVSGIIGAPIAGLSLTLPAGVAYILGQRTTPAAYAYTYPASSDCYVDLKPDGTYTVAAVANGVAEPAVTAGAVRTQVVVTSATDVAGVTQRISGVTPPQFDTSSKIATMAAVQRAIGNYSGFNYITADVAMTSSAFGGFFQFSTPTSVTATLPTHSSISAQTITFKNDSGVDCYIQTVESGGVIIASGIVFGSSVTLTLRPGESVTLLSRASPEWDVVDGVWLQNWSNNDYMGSNSFAQPVSAANATTSGQLLALGQSITGATRTDVTASRAVSTAYTNSLTRPIKVYIAGTSTASNAWLARQIGTGTVFYAEISNSGNHVTLELLVMPGETYTITSSNVTINMWEEIR